MPLRAVAEALDRLDCRGRPLLIAVSGGLDSVALLHALHLLQQRSGCKLAVGHVNHGLRGEDSEADQGFVRGLAGRLGHAFAAARVAPREERLGGSSRDRPTLQEAARRLRYRALRSLADELGCARIATAHTLDDQAETVLLRLLRGTGPDGLGGIPERSPDAVVVRPLLAVSRQEIERFAEEHRLTWREDVSNASPDYARNRLRRRLPELAREFNPQLLRRLAALAEAQRGDSAWIAGEVEREAEWRLAADAAGIEIDTKEWDALPPALARRVAREALVRGGAGRHVTRRHLERICEFLAGGPGGKHIELPGGLRLVRRAGRVRLMPDRTGKTTC